MFGLDKLRAWFSGRGRRQRAQRQTAGQIADLVAIRKEAESNILVFDEAIARLGEKAATATGFERDRLDNEVRDLKTQRGQVHNQYRLLVEGIDRVRKLEASKVATAILQTIQLGQEVIHQTRLGAKQAMETAQKEGMALDGIERDTDAAQLSREPVHELDAAERPSAMREEQASDANRSNERQGRTHEEPLNQ